MIQIRRKIGVVSRQDTGNDEKYVVNILTKKLSLRLPGKVTNRPGKDDWTIKINKAVLPGGCAESFGLKTGKDGAIVTAPDRLGLLAGSGKLVREIDFSGKCPSISEMEVFETPKIRGREAYCAAHFRNSYEFAWPAEMKEFLEDLAMWGINTYGDWFDTNGMGDPYSQNKHQHHPGFYNPSIAVWEKKKHALRMAQEIGMKIEIVVAPNTVFLDQYCGYPGLRAETDERSFGQIFCPNIKKAREIILANQKNLFRDLAEYGIKVDSVLYFVYDNGGCACKKCHPYLKTFIPLMQEIHSVISKYHPACKADLCGWHVKDEELSIVWDWLAEKQPEWLNGFSYALSNSKTDVPALLKKNLSGYELSSFVNLSYSGNSKDVYGRTGAHVAPGRLKYILSQFKSRECSGFEAYSEGFFDHLNMCLIARLGYDTRKKIRDILGEYCRWYFKTNKASTRAIVDTLIEMENLDLKKAAKWKNRLERTRPEVDTVFSGIYKYEHIFYKTKLLTFDYEIGSPSQWAKTSDMKRLIRKNEKLIQERAAVYERLQRQVYGMAPPVIWIFSIPFIPPEWFKSWQEWKTKVLSKE